MGMIFDSSIESEKSIEKIKLDCENFYDIVLYKDQGFIGHRTGNK